MDEVRRLGAFKDEKINEAKKILAYEVTKLVHGQEEADKAAQAAEALFGGAGNADSMPTVVVAQSKLGTKLLDVLAEGGVFESKGEGKRLITQNGVALNDNKVDSIEAVLNESDFVDGQAIVKKGKKKFYRLQLGE